jgi:hypothetical protein
MPGTLITIGGGGFSEATEPELDVYVLQQSPQACPRIGFIGTASGDSDHYLVKLYRISCTVAGILEEPFAIDTLRL